MCKVGECQENEWTSRQGKAFREYFPSPQECKDTPTLLVSESSPITVQLRITVYNRLRIKDIFFFFFLNRQKREPI